MIRISEIPSLILSISGNLFLGGLYLAALINPQNAEFMFRTGMLFYIVEFLSLHSSGMAFGIRGKEREGADHKSTFNFSARGPGNNLLQANPKYTLVGLYSVFVLAIGLVFKNYYIPFYFFISVLTKFFGKKAAKDNVQVGLPIFLFLAATFISLISTPILVKIFPISDQILQNRVPGSSGHFVDFPQSLMVWGIVYFISLSIMEVVLFLRQFRGRTQFTK